MTLMTTLLKLKIRQLRTDSANAEIIPILILS